MKMISVILASVLAFFSSTYVELIGIRQSGEPGTGGPKKYFTLSFDDGITQDYELMKICRKYNYHGITFNINTGLCGANWDWVGGAIGSPSTTHIRLTKDEIKNGAYDGFDLAVHTLTHPSMKKFDSNPLGLWREVQKDAFNIYRWTGTMPVGMAWPGGDTEYTETTMEYVRKYTTIRYARAVTSTYNFSIPTEFLKWQPTCSITDEKVLELAKQFLEADCSEDMLFYVWGHAYELEAFDKYPVVEELIRMMSESEDVVCVSNTEFYNMFGEKAQ